MPGYFKTTSPNHVAFFGRLQSRSENKLFYFVRLAWPFWTTKKTTMFNLDLLSWSRIYYLVFTSRSLMDKHVDILSPRCISAWCPVPGSCFLAQRENGSHERTRKETKRANEKRALVGAEPTGKRTKKKRKAQCEHINSSHTGTRLFFYSFSGTLFWGPCDFGL